MQSACQCLSMDPLLRKKRIRKQVRGERGGGDVAVYLQRSECLNAGEAK